MAEVKLKGKTIVYDSEDLISYLAFYKGNPFWQIYMGQVYGFTDNEEVEIVIRSKTTRKGGVMIYCTKCANAEAQEGTDPPMCTDCMSQKGGGNDPETEEITHLMLINREAETQEKEE